MRVYRVTSFLLVLYGAAPLHKLTDIVHLSGLSIPNIYTYKNATNYLQFFSFSNERNKQVLLSCL